MTNLPMSRQSNLVEQELPKELLIYDLEINKAYCLNETSALVWKLCDGKNSISNISKILSRTLRSEVSEDFVFLALDQFRKDNLLTNSSIIKDGYEDVSRRAMIKKVGLTTMIALPLISSIAAPTAVMSASAATFCSTNINTTPCGTAGICCNSQCCEGAAACTGIGGGCP